MRRALWTAGVLTLLTLVGGAATFAWAWSIIHRPYRGHRGAQVVAIEPGRGASGILAELEAVGVLRDRRLARAYLVWWLDDRPLKAGEYRFDGPLTTPQVLAKLIRGEVVTYPATVIEGLTLDEAATTLAEQGFGDRAVLRREMDRAGLILDLDPAATDLEGYLYPDTYHFARQTPEAAIVATMVRTFRRRYSETLATQPTELDVRSLVTLASIVEKEAQVHEERSVIAGVYANRLRRGIALYADPTIIYALKQQRAWDGNLRRADLALDNPYNTYLYPGLPPGPICSPGLPSLRAAASPAEVPFLYFVSRNDGTHVFAETFREHQRNVDRWQRQYWRQRWAEESSRGR